MSVDILMFFQKISNPALDKLFITITNFGSETFYIIFITSIFWLFNKRLGTKLFVITVGSIYLNVVFKDLFHTERPIFYKGINALYQESAPGYSFPSGHTQGSTTFWTYLMIRIKNKYFSILACSIIFLVGFSRLYLRVHWPVDVIGGFVIGLTIVLLGDYIMEKMLKMKFSFTLALVLSLTLPSLLLLINTNENNVKILALLTGALLGFIIEIRYIDFEEKGPILKQIVKYAVGIIIFIGIRSVLKIILPPGLISDYARYFICGIWTTLFAPIVFLKIGISEKRIRY